LKRIAREGSSSSLGLSAAKEWRGVAVGLIEDRLLRLLQQLPSWCSMSGLAQGEAAQPPVGLAAGAANLGALLIVLSCPGLHTGALDPSLASQSVLQS
jgi:hypothetical protein